MISMYEYVPIEVVGGEEWLMCGRRGEAVGEKKGERGEIKKLEVPPKTNSGDFLQSNPDDRQKFNLASDRI